MKPPIQRTSWTLPVLVFLQPTAQKFPIKCNSTHRDGATSRAGAGLRLRKRGPARWSDVTVMTSGFCSSDSCEPEGGGGGGGGGNQLCGIKKILKQESFNVQFAARFPRFSHFCQLFAIFTLFTLNTAVNPLYYLTWHFCNYVFMTFIFAQLHKHTK